MHGVLAHECERLQRYARTRQGHGDACAILNWRCDATDACDDVRIERRRSLRVRCPHLGGAIAAFTWRGADVLRADARRGARRAQRAARIAAIRWCPIRIASATRCSRFGGTRLRARAQLRRPSARDPRRRLAARVAVAAARSDTRATARSSTTADDERSARGRGRFARRRRSRCRRCTVARRSTLTLTLANTGAQRFRSASAGIRSSPQHAATTLALRRPRRLAQRRDATAGRAHRRCRRQWRFARRARLAAPRRSTTCSPAGRRARRSTIAGRGVARRRSRPIARAAASSSTRRRARDFIALEPVTHETDAFNRARARRDGHRNARTLPPGARVFLYDARSPRRALLRHHDPLRRPPTSPFACVLDVAREPRRMPGVVVAEQALYWVDINAPSLNRFDPATGSNTRDADAGVDRLLRAARSAAGSSSRCATASGSRAPTARSSARSRPRPTIPRIIASTTAAAIRRAASSPATMNEKRDADVGRALSARRRLHADRRASTT